MRRLPSLAHIGLIGAVLGCAACALPAAAPTAVRLELPPAPADNDYFLVPLEPLIVQIMGDRPSPGFPAAFHLANYRPSIALRPGDVIGVTVYEAGGLPIFGALPARSQFAEAAPSGPNPSDANPLSPRSLGLKLGALDLTPTGQTPAPPTTSSSTSAPSAPSAPTMPPKTTTLPPLTVEVDGDILIPYAGRIAVAGLTPTEAAERIKEALGNQTLRPQVLVSYIANPTSIATVGGEANRPSPVVLTLRGERVLDVLGQAGGSKWPAPDTSLDIIRGSVSARVKLQTIIDNPRENIVVRPDDQIFLTHDPRTFTVLGASQKVSQYTFDVPKVSLAEAVGRAGGAIDTIGNPAAVYLFREEPTPVAAEVLGVISSHHQHAPNEPLIPIDPSRVKLVYKINMNEPEGYFLARRTMMRDKDVVLIANAEGAQLLKVFTLVRGVTGAASDLNVFGVGGPGGTAR